MILCNPRMTEVGRKIWVPLAQLLLQHGHPEHSEQTHHGQAASEGLQGGDSSANVPAPHSTALLPGVQRKPPVFHFVIIAACPGTGHLWNEIGSILFASSLQVLISKISEPLLPSQLSQPLLIRELLHPLDHLAGPPLDSSASPGLSCTRGSSEPDTALQVQTQQCLVQWKDHLSWYTNVST